VARSPARPPRAGRRAGGWSLALAAAAIAAMGASAFLPDLHAQQPAPTVFHSPSCPVPAEVRGYPVTVVRVDGAPLDSAYAAALADAVARRWETPSPGRGRHPGLGRVANRVHTPEPLWADDWVPEDRHTARIAATLHRDGGVRAVVVEAASGDRLYDRSLESIFGSRAAEPALPFPGSLAEDSIRVRVWLGVEPEGGGGPGVRFAAQQSPVRVVPGSLQVFAPPGGPGARPGARPSATVKYDVDADGALVPGSVQVLRSSGAEFSRRVTEGVRRARFVPAQANCRPVARSVAQRFGDP
jgi:hypothetical protein